jgi:small GTP-binding protein
MDVKHETNKEPETKEQEEKYIDMRLYISIAILGSVSVGKSTLMNSLFAEQYSDMRIKRTTMLPQVYQETEDDGIISDKQIRKENTEHNKKIYDDANNKKKLTLEDCKELVYQVPKLHDFIDNKRQYYINVYDLPGIDDADLKDVYTAYLEKQFSEFDIVIFMLDINNAFNRADEVQLFRSVIRQIKRQITEFHKNVYLIICINKCDDMFIDEKDPNTIHFENEEYKEMYEDIYSRVMKMADEEKLDKKYCNNFSKISAEDSFIYRCIKKNKDNKLDDAQFNKLALNDIGKNKWRTMKQKEKEKYIDKIVEKVRDDQYYQERMIQCGFKNFSNMIRRIVGVENQYLFLMNHIRNEIQSIGKMTDDNTERIMLQYDVVYKKIYTVGRMFKKDDQKIIKDDITKKIDTYIQSMGKESITNQNIANKYAIHQENLEYLIKHSTVKRLYNVNKLLETRTLICAYSEQYHLNIILSGKCNDPRELKPHVNRLQECQFKKIIEVVDNINLKNLLLFKEGYDHPEHVIEWCKYIRNELKYDNAKIKQFLQNWLVSKQTYLRVTVNNNNGTADEQDQRRANFLNYCYDLDYYLTQLCCKIDLGKNENFYKNLSINNKKTIVSMIGGMGGACYLKETDNELLLERYLFDNFM